MICLYLLVYFIYNACCINIVIYVTLILYLTCTRLHLIYDYIQLEGVKQLWEAFFGVVSKHDCVMDLFFGTDYHSHLGTRRGGMAVYGENGFQRSIHNIENSPFRTKFERDVEELSGNAESVLFLTMSRSRF